MKIYRCNACGDIVITLNEACLQCCGQEMKELVANTTDAATEKHVPVVNIVGDTLQVSIGEIPHPMQNEHYINFVVLETESGFYLKHLKPNEKPETAFSVSGEKPLAVYEYCNLHGLWKKEL